MPMKSCLYIILLPFVLIFTSNSYASGVDLLGEYLCKEDCKKKYLNEKKECEKCIN